MSEAEEQRAVVEYCDWRRIPCFHIPNGGKRSSREAYNLKRQGVRPGVPDRCIPVPSGRYHGLFIEMKRAEGGTVSDHQREWVSRLNGLGYLARVCHGADSAISLIDSYISLP